MGNRMYLDTLSGTQLLIGRDKQTAIDNLIGYNREVLKKLYSEREIYKVIDAQLDYIIELHTINILDLAEIVNEELIEKVIREVQYNRCIIIREQLVKNVLKIFRDADADKYIYIWHIEDIIGLIEYILKTEYTVGSK